jgi:radical SAM family protein/4Fe-4S single cluster protein
MPKVGLTRLEPGQGTACLAKVMLFLVESGTNRLEDPDGLKNHTLGGVCEFSGLCQKIVQVTHTEHFMKKRICRPLHIDKSGRFEASLSNGGTGSMHRFSGGRFFSLGKGGRLWRMLHFLKYGLPYRLGVERSSRKGGGVNRINLLAVEHCNNSCRHCSTSSPYAGKRSHSAAAFFPWLDLLMQEGIEFTDIAITGGEPFLHSDVFVLIDELDARYPDKEIGLTTNFFWASENKIRTFAPRLKSLDRMLISKYPNVVAKLGGERRFRFLVDLVREQCPHIGVDVADGSHLIAWELHGDKRKPESYCCTSDCYVLRTDGKISHCSIGVGLEHRPEYLEIAKESKERLYDLSQGGAGFLSWMRKYPFDLCSHCTLWQGVQVPWESRPPRFQISPRPEEESQC